MCVRGLRPLDPVAMGFAPQGIPALDPNGQGAGIAVSRFRSGNGCFQDVDREKYVEVPSLVETSGDLEGSAKRSVVVYIIILAINII